MGYYIGVDLLTERMTNTKIDELCSDGGVSMTFAAQNAFLANIITRAEGLINGYAGRIYMIPLPNVPVVQEWVLRMCEYELYRRGSGDDIPTKYKNAYDEAIKEMADFTKGSFVIPGSIKLRKQTGLSMETDSDTPVFTETAFYKPAPGNGVSGIWM